MDISGNTILITGGGSGIGRGLAEAFAKEGNHVVIAGRRQATLDEVTRANPEIESMTFDVSDPQAIKSFAEKVVAKYPKLNVLINNAGMMKPEMVAKSPTDISVAEATITTNLLGPIRLTAALLPQLMKQKKSIVMTTTSGLAFVPFPSAPSYSATKAAMHAYSIVLRHQLKDTSVEVLELPPPYVQTELGGDRQKNDPRAMPLDEYIAEVMSILKSPVKDGEILVERVKPLRYAERDGKFDEMFGMLVQMAESR